MKKIMSMLISIGLCACGSSNSDAHRAKDSPGSKSASHKDTAPPDDVTWTPSPSLDAVPPGPIRGNASGRAFAGKTVIFEPGFESWKMIIADEALSSPAADLPSCRHLDLDLPKPPTAGIILHKPMSYGGGYFQLDTPRTGRMLSWNDENAWALEIASWNVKPWDPKGGVLQNAGTAAGRIVVMYRSNREDLENTWVAGSFDEAVVRYSGRPYWAPEKASTSDRGL